jgi:hypothetical protein
VKFTHGGTTMSQVSSYPDNFVTAVNLSPNFATDNTLFAAGYHGLYKSTDGGSTWADTRAPARIEESQNIAGPLEEPPIITYQGTWSSVTPSTVASSNAYMLTSTYGDTAVLEFTGSGIGWVTWTGPHQGRASIQLDGVSQGTVNLTAPVDQYQQLVWQKQGLTCDTHTLIVTALPQSGQTVTLDAFNVRVNNCPLVNALELSQPVAPEITVASVGLALKRVATDGREHLKCYGSSISTERDMLYCTAQLHVS